MHSVEQTSVIARPAAEVWERAITEEGINDELAPILRMTMPAGLRGKTVDDGRGRRPARAQLDPARRAAAGRLRRPLPRRARARPPLPRALADAHVLGLAARAHRRAGGRALAAGSPTGSASSSSAAGVAWIPGRAADRRGDRRLPVPPPPPAAGVGAGERSQCASSAACAGGRDSSASEVSSSTPREASSSTSVASSAERA